MNFKNSTQLGVLVLALLCAPMAHAKTLLDEAKEHFMAHRFYAAEDCLNRAAAANPQDQFVRYLLGQTMEQLYDDRAAKQAYTDCYRINPFNDEGVAAKNALIQLNGRVEAKSHEPMDDPKTTAHTIDILHRQSRELQGNYVRNGNSQAAWSLDKGNREAAALGYDTQMTLNSLRYGRHGMYDYNSQQEISERSQIRTSWIRADAQVKALQNQAQAVHCAREVANSAANLETLLAEKKRPGDAKLRALGTQLYVRYYGTEDHDAPTAPEDPPIELKATEGKLSTLPAVKVIPAKETTTSLSEALGSALRSTHY